MKKKKTTNPWIIFLIVALSIIGLIVLLSIFSFIALLLYVTPVSQETTNPNHQIPDGAIRVIQEDVSQDLIACTPSQRNTDICTTEYRPVCGYRDFPENCNSPDCSETFSNSCNACSNTKILYYVNGPCRAE